MIFSINIVLFNSSAFFATKSKIRILPRLGNEVKVLRSVSIQSQCCHILIRLFRHLMHLTRVKLTFKSLLDIYRPKYISLH